MASSSPVYGVSRHVREELLVRTPVDLSQWPIIVVHTPRDFTDAELRAYYDEIARTMLSRPEPYCNVIDARNASAPTPSQRKIMADFRVTHEEHIRKYCRGSAFVFESGLMRGVITAIHWLRRPEMPHKSFGTMFEAMTWARVQLEVAKAQARDPLARA
jgi:hypothetical protein